MSDKRIPLGKGKKLNLIGKDSKDCEYQIVYIIRDIVGYGRSSILYRAETTDRNETEMFTKTHMIKEFYPSVLADGMDCITRNADGVLVIPEGLQDRFNKRKDYFLSNYSKHMTFYENSPDQPLHTPTIKQENNTVYSIMEFRDGDMLEKNRNELSSLYDIVEVIISLVNAIRYYHQSSPALVHLDIKPQNIFKYQNENRIALFDFDTVQKLDDIQCGLALNPSYSKTWGAPELKFKETYPKICEATDIFSIGAVMFWLIMEREPTSRDTDTILGGKWDLQKESRFCQMIEHQKLTLIRKIFTHTLRNLISDRYQNTEEILIELINLRNLCAPTLYLLKGSRTVDDLFKF